MALQKNLPHLIVASGAAPEAFKSKKSGGGPKPPSPVPNREAHARKLQRQLKPIVRAVEAAAARQDLSEGERGIYVAVSGRPGEPLNSEALDRKGVELIAVEEGKTARALLFLEPTAKDVFPELVEEYRTKDSTRSKAATPPPANRPLVESIGSFEIATTAQHFWADDPAAFPPPKVKFLWEVWLRGGHDERFRAVAKAKGVAVAGAGLTFPEASVVRVDATRERMSELIEATNAVARLRRTSVTADFFDGLPHKDQADTALELLKRTTFSSIPNAPRVCVMDTGVNRGHMLLSPACSELECNAVDLNWGNDDHDGHGTQIAGVALYGDLTHHLDSSSKVEIRHRIESVKIFPPKGQNPHDLLGRITRDGVQIAEALGEITKRAFCLATTTETDAGHYGAPSSWSAEIDQLAAGVGPHGDKRLLFVSAGNLGRHNLLKADAYPTANDAAEIESPAQSWNAVTVGGFTNKIVLTDATMKGWKPLAPQGDLSPVSRTASWDGEWPVKPDIVLEGGNMAVAPGSNDALGAVDLSVLTTSSKSPNPVFATTDATSAATADAARIAAIIWSQYPDLWPETVRALLASSARWTPAMQEYLPSTKKKKAGDYIALLKRYGHGVPNLERALHSASNALTLIVQDTLQPYKKEKSDYKLNEAKLFQLPWPRQALEELGTTTARLRIALSYFIEPNPSEVQRGRKLRYASHGLRFRLNLPNEDESDFRKRYNKLALSDGEKVTAADTKGWVLGAINREVGSLHCDTWSGYASDLARRNMIAVYPVGGWWKERPHLGRWDRQARFALIVTIDTPSTEVDLYTPVKTFIETEVEAI